LSPSALQHDLRISAKIALEGDGVGLWAEIDDCCTALHRTSAVVIDSPASKGTSTSTGAVLGPARRTLVVTCHVSPSARVRSTRQRRSWRPRLSRGRRAGVGRQKLQALSRLAVVPRPSTNPVSATTSTWRGRSGSAMRIVSTSGEAATQRHLVHAARDLQPQRSGLVAGKPRGGLAVDRERDLAATGSRRGKR